MIDTKALNGAAYHATLDADVLFCCPINGALPVLPNRGRVTLPAFSHIGPMTLALFLPVSL
jgi:hypothetical protein